MKPNTVTHTPTPWVSRGSVVARLSMGGGDAIICEVSTGADDADYIRRSVNVHAELLGAFLEMAYAYHAPHHGKPSECDNVVCEDNRRIIAKAGQ